MSRRFSTQVRTGTSPELALRRQLHRLGLRYRVHHRIAGLPRRRVDLAFTRVRVVVLVDGCFWHGCPQHGNLPRANREWWTWKLSGNRERDADTDRRLGELGWTVHRVWEHEDMEEAAAVIRKMVVGRWAALSARVPRRPADAQPC